MSNLITKSNNSIIGFINEMASLQPIIDSYKIFLAYDDVFSKFYLHKICLHKKLKIPVNFF